MKREKWEIILGGNRFRPSYKITYHQYNKKNMQQYVRGRSHISRGITLIALIITIILMLILAGIVLSLTMGENGLIQKAQNAGVTYEENIAREKLELVLLDMRGRQSNKSRI